MESAYRNFAVCASNGREALVGFFKFLIFLAIFLHPVNCVNFEDTFLKIPALGRISHLGSVYDARTDSFNGLNILKSNLPRHLITTAQTPRINKQAKIIKKESDKFELFGVDLDTAASIQTGIVQPEGAASVLSEDVTSSKGITGIFLQTFQIAEQSLPVFQEELKKYFNTDAELYTHATHVVTGISWGGSISVKFSDNPSNKRSSIQSSNLLNQEFKKLRRTSGNIGSQSRFEMHLTSDVSLQNPLPATLREVREQINRVEDSIKIINSGLGSPLKFTLTPIYILKKYLNVTTSMTTEAHIVNQEILRVYSTVIDDIIKVEKTLINIEENSNCVTIELGREMEHLLSNFNAAEQTFKKEFKKVILDVKSGIANNSALLQVLRNYESQDFNPKNMKITLNGNAQGLQKVELCSQLNQEYPDIEYFGSAPNLISKIYENHNKPTYVLFTKSKFKESDRVSFDDNLNIVLNILYKPSNALFIVDCDFSYTQCESINETVIKQIRQGNYTFSDVRLEIKITEMENKTEVVQCNKESGVTGALCVSTMERTSAKSKTKTLNRNQINLSESESETSKKVVGGKTAHPNEFPFQVLFLNSATELHCGGTILNENFILTAAHCLYDYDAEEYQSWTIVAGDHNWQIDEGPEQRRQIRDLQIHENYKPDFDVNDVAIVKLDRPLNFSKAVQPIMLPNADYEATGDAVVTGWGKLRFGGSNPLVLQKVTVPIVDRADCVKAYEEVQVFISVKMMCAGELGVGGMDACQGDSGGPLSVKLGNGSSLLVGVVSSGIGCARPEYPGIYMQVSKYVDWISDTLNNFDNVTDNCLQQNLCKNGGTCIDRINSYSCTCAGGYEGQDCAAVKNYCVPSNPCLNGGTCVRGINSYTCDCTDGFTGNECQDVNECRQLGTCNSLPGDENCGRCHDGFIKDPKDDTRCKIASSNASLIISSWADIKTISLDGQNTTQILQNGAYFYGTDFSFRTKTIFWFTGFDKKIYTALINEDDAKKSIFQDSSSSVYGVAVDWIYQHLYWVDDNRRRICVSNFEGTLKKVLFNDGLLVPNSIAVNPLNGWMYWSDRHKHRIERAGMDGSRRKVILSTNVKDPFGLVIDFVESRLYWSQGEDPSSIWSSDFDGSDPKLVFTPNSFQLPSSMFWKIATFAKYVYFIDDRSNTIYRVNKCNGKELEMVHKSESYLKDIKIYDETVQPEGENLCLKRTGRCSHFCFPVPSPGNGSASTTTCGCAEGHSFLTDQQNCD